MRCTGEHRTEASWEVLRKRMFCIEAVVSGRSKLFRVRAPGILQWFSESLSLRKKGGAPG